MNDQCRAKLDWAAQIWRGCGVVDDQGNARVIGDIGNRAHVHDIAAGVGNRLAKDRLRVVIDRGLHRVQIVKVDKGRGPAETLDRLGELRDRATIKPRAGDDILTRCHQRKQRHQLGRMTGRTADTACAAFKRCDPFLQRCDRGVGQARIDIADLLQVKQRRRVVRIAEHIGRRLIDRHLPRTRGRVGACTRVNL